MADDQKVDNNLLPNYTVETVQQGDGAHRQVFEVGSFGSGVTLPVQDTVTLTHTRPSIASGDGSEVVIAANASRKVGGWVTNLNFGNEFFLNIGTDAADGEGIPLFYGQTFQINTQQEIRAFQNSGGALSLEVYEAT